MNQDHDHPSQAPGVDLQRRRLTKAGLAAPAVLGVLASRPVLANPVGQPSFHQCTPSGHISGFASANNQADCLKLGNGPDHYAGGPSTWPNGNVNNSYFINSNGGVRAFKNSPNGVSVKLADAYQRRRLSDDNITNATVWDVLNGFVTKADGTESTGFVLEARNGFNSDLSLGAEALAVLMAALVNFPAGYPISPEQIITMFNNVVVTGGIDPNVGAGASWNAAEVKEYFQSLHS